MTRKAAESKPEEQPAESGLAENDWKQLMSLAETGARSTIGQFVQQPGTLQDIERIARTATRLILTATEERKKDSRDNS